jgi:hypothetical protein
MKQRITVVYRRGKRVLTYSYVTEIKSPFANGIALDSHAKTQSIAWNEVLSVNIQPEISV